jgi:hypothetical protein
MFFFKAIKKKRFKRILGLEQNASGILGGAHGPIPSIGKWPLFFPREYDGSFTVQG